MTTAPARRTSVDLQVTGFKPFISLEILNAHGPLAECNRRDAVKRLHRRVVKSYVDHVRTKTAGRMASRLPVVRAAPVLAVCTAQLLDADVRRPVKPRGIGERGFSPAPERRARVALLLARLI
jgi:hypothetical protein